MASNPWLHGPHCGCPWTTFPEDCPSRCQPTGDYRAALASLARAVRRYYDERGVTVIVRETDDEMRRALEAAEGEVGHGR